MDLTNTAVEWKGMMFYFETRLREFDAGEEVRTVLAVVYDFDGNKQETAACWKALTSEDQRQIMQEVRQKVIARWQK